MDDKRFPSPLELRLTEPHTRRVATVWEAIECLGRQGRITSVVGPEQATQCLTSGFWPDKSGVAFENAMSACLKSLSGVCAPERAREAFISAAKHAHILVEDEIAH